MFVSRQIENEMKRCSFDVCFTCHMIKLSIRVQSNCHWIESNATTRRWCANRFHRRWIEKDRKTFFTFNGKLFIEKIVTFAKYRKLVVYCGRWKMNRKKHIFLSKYIIETDTRWNVYYVNENIITVDSNHSQAKQFWLSHELTFDFSAFVWSFDVIWKRRVDRKLLLKNSFSNPREFRWTRN